jgi:hypothetical protein
MGLYFDRKAQKGRKVNFPTSLDHELLKNCKIGNCKSTLCGGADAMDDFIVNHNNKKHSSYGMKSFIP